jgi:hypothetical protein
MLVQLTSETSADGYIFRTDRLRPDPGRPLAASVQAAELYYERRPELGASGHDQGPSGGRQPDRRAAFPMTSALHLA